MTKDNERYLSIKIPEFLYRMLSRLCVDVDMTKTEIIVGYLYHLNEHKDKFKDVNIPKSNHLKMTFLKYDSIDED